LRLEREQNFGRGNEILRNNLLEEVKVMATAMQSAINKATGVSRNTTRAIRKNQLRTAARRKSRGGQGG